MRVVVGARLLKPQRLMNLSLSEEDYRTLMYWRDVDFRMSNMCCGPIRWLQMFVQNPIWVPAEFEEHCDLHE